MIIDACHNGIELTVPSSNRKAMRQGVYSFNGTDPATGLPTYYQNGGVSAMWFTDGRWRIGERKNLGTTNAGIMSTKAEQCPEMIETDWAYSENDGKFVVTDKISIAPHSG